MFEPVPPSTIVSILGVYLLVFGVVTIAGGVIGFVKAKSRASLIAGSISGSLLVVAGWLVSEGSRAGLFIGLTVSMALLARFGRAFLKTKKVMPAGLIALLAIGGIALPVFVLAP